MFRKSSLFVAILILVPIVAACSSTTTTTTATVTQPITVTSTSTLNSTVTATYTAVITTLTIAPTPTATGTPTTTVGDLELLGQSGYEADCTQTYCHASFAATGAQSSYLGIPATVEFSKSANSYFGNAQAMFVFIKSFMHHPDTASFLTDDQYLQVLAYLLYQNGTVTLSQPFGLSNLATITLPAS